MYENLKAANLKRWNAVKINPNSNAQFTAVANRLAAAKDRYKAVEAKTGVPWWFTAVVHEREASQSWSANLAQGDPWNRKSTHVPAGRGPFKSWEEAAVDALVNCAPHAAHNKDWSPGGALTMLELYNGLGYANKGKPSPYVWAGTDQYVKGKYVADGAYNPNYVDKQLGCAGLLVKLAAFKANVSVPGTATVGGAVATGAGAAAVSTGISWLWIVAGVTLGAVALYEVIHWYKNRNKTNVV